MSTSYHKNKNNLYHIMPNVLGAAYLFCNEADPTPTAKSSTDFCNLIVSDFFKFQIWIWFFKRHYESNRNQTHVLFDPWDRRVYGQQGLIIDDFFFFFFFWGGGGGVFMYFKLCIDTQIHDNIQSMRLTDSFRVEVLYMISKITPKCRGAM